MKHFIFYVKNTRGFSHERFKLSRLGDGYKGKTTEELEEMLREWSDKDLELCIDKLAENYKKESMNNE